jgi:hypothetical protein
MNINTYENVKEVAVMEKKSKAVKSKALGH